jgi:hypothetical protein
LFLIKNNVLSGRLSLAIERFFTEDKYIKLGAKGESPVIKNADKGEVAF